MNYPIIFRLLGVILIALAIAFLTCMGVGLLYYTPFERNALQRWLACLTIVVVLATTFLILSRNASPKMLRKEGLCVIGIGWILTSLIGALPFWLLLPDFSFVDSIFESVSGLTTTGASVIARPEKLPHSLLFWRSMSQWIGGLGVVVFFVAILSFLGAGAKILYSGEASGQAADMDSSRIQKGILHILLLYLGISAIGTITYYLLGMDLFDATCHMFATISTGGFSTHSNSIAYFNNPSIEWATVFFMIIGGTSFFILLKILSFSWTTVKQNTELHVYLGIILSFTILTTLLLSKHFEANGQLFSEAFRTSIFQVVSVMTTTGFSTLDYDSWVPAAHVFLMMLMITGGCSGSTAGGLKLIRVIAALKIGLYHIEKAFRTNIVRSININKKPLEHHAQDSILAFIVTACFIFVLSLLLVAALQHNLSFEGNFSALLACLANIGPGFAEVGPGKNFAFFQDETKLFFSFIMITGRLELYAILVLFAPSLWKRFS